MALSINRRSLSGASVTETSFKQPVTGALAQLPRFVVDIAGVAQGLEQPGSVHCRLGRAGFFMDQHHTEGAGKQGVTGGMARLRSEGQGCEQRPAEGECSDQYMSGQRLHVHIRLLRMVPILGVFWKM